MSQLYYFSKCIFQLCQKLMKQGGVSCYGTKLLKFVLQSHCLQTEKTKLSERLALELSDSLMNTSGLVALCSLVLLHWLKTVRIQFTVQQQWLTPLCNSSCFYLSKLKDTQINCCHIFNIFLACQHLVCHWYIYDSLILGDISAHLIHLISNPVVQ